ncbi:cation diffusion facilitator family transporter [Candidatus Liberibacter sp.]|uniref:cation diffusion facilitator family transporter n=1 Tax=Candidatus Liberibacter sp. TaxID=34022 RepID=UPI0015F58762|nr:cation transporter [Candidatus Liberibacter sp.]MBA5724199.1 cation transporter [Candidatus Liberibacter sp.]
MHDYKARSKSEQWLLKLSISITILIASTNLIFGFFSGSFSIVFDGFYAFFDAGITALSLLVAKLISQDALESNPNEGRRYFQFGFWHLEPMVLALNSILMLFGTFYAFAHSISSLVSGGSDVSFNQAILYSAIAGSICLIMGFYEKKCNRTIQSDFLVLDARAWIVAGIILYTLVIAFFCGFFLENSAYSWLSLYIDPLILIVISLFVFSSSVRVMKRAMFEIFQMTPPDFDMQVKKAIYPIVIRHGFLDFYTYVTKIGRSRFIEIHLIVPLHYPIKSVASLDEIRQEIGDAIGGFEQNRWLTISFTTQKRWAV